MKIALDGLPLLTPKTGIGRYTWELGNALNHIQNGPQAHFFYGIHHLHRLKQNLSDKNRKNNHILLTESFSAHHDTRWMPDSIKTTLKNIAALGECRLRRPDLFHATNYTAARFDIPLVVTVHDLSFIRYPQAHFKERLNWIETSFYNTLDRASSIICPSNFTKNELIELVHIPEEDIHVTWYGINRSFKQRNTAEIVFSLNEYNLSPQQYVLSVGTLEPRKNIETLIKAYHMLPAKLQERLPLVIVGIRGWKEKEIYRLIKDERVSGNIRILGYVPENVLPFIFSGASLFVFPSLYEGFGFPPLEAMACGVPTIVSDKASLPEVVGNGAVQLNPQNIEKLSELMELLLTDKRLRRQLIDKGLKRAKIFTWEACAESTYNIYKKTLNNL